MDSTNHNVFLATGTTLINENYGQSSMKFNFNLVVKGVQSCQVTLDISGSPIDLKWSSHKYPGQPWQVWAYLGWNDRYAKFHKYLTLDALNFLSFSTWHSSGNFSTWGPFYQHGLTFIPAWISNYIHYNVWDEITYPFLNFNGCTVEV